MFYRFVDDERRAVDLENIHSGSCILVGGAPDLENPDQWKMLQQLGITTMAMNNVATNFKPTYWVGADKSDNYSKSIIHDPSYLHFGYLSRCTSVSDGKPWKDYRNTIFLGSSEHIKASEFFDPLKHFVWWRNVFLLAIQVLYHLGFKKIYLLGCSFNISSEEQYSFETRLTAEQIDYNKNTYNMVLGQLKDIMPYFERHNFELISCTEESKLNNVIDYMKFEDVIKIMKDEIPKHDSINVDHPLLEKRRKKDESKIENNDDYIIKVF